MMKAGMRKNATASREERRKRSQSPGRRSEDRYMILIILHAFGAREFERLLSLPRESTPASLKRTIFAIAWRHEERGCEKNLPHIKELPPAAKAALILNRLRHE